MRRLVAALLLAGCASRLPLEEPTITSVPAQLIADSGASLYVLEGPEEWWASSAEYGEIDEAPLKKLLRFGLSQASVTLVGHADFLVTEGHPCEVTLFNPDSRAHRPRPDGGMIGFRVRLKAETIADEKKYARRSCSVEWSAEKLTDRPAKNQETQRDVEAIGSGHRDLAFGAGYLIRWPTSGGREFTLLIRIVSLEDP